MEGGGRRQSQRTRKVPPPAMSEEQREDDSISSTPKRRAAKKPRKSELKVDDLTVAEDYMEVDISKEQVVVELPKTTLSKRSQNSEVVEKRKRAAAQRQLMSQMKLIHLVCYLASGKRFAQLMQSVKTQCQILSLIPAHICRQFSSDDIKKGRAFDNAITMLYTWWQNSGFSLRQHGDATQLSPVIKRSTGLRLSLHLKQAYEEYYVLLFCIALQVLGLHARVVSSVSLVGENPKVKGSPMKRISPSWWVEVFSPIEKVWSPIDPINGISKCNAGFKCDSSTRDHLFVFAWEPSGFVLDVTQRYSKKFNSHVWKCRMPFEEIVAESITRFNTGLNGLKLYDEHAELLQFSEKEPFPTSIAELRFNRKFILESNLRKYEVFYPDDRIVGQFKGENVHLRENIQKVRSKEAWFTQFGKVIREGEIPAKIVLIPRKPPNMLSKRVKAMIPEAKQLVTKEKEYAEQPLYGGWQTDWYKPPPAKDGIVPKNQYGNVDLFQECMLPDGCTYIPDNLAAKAAKELRVDFANACVRFCFHGRFAVPDIQGIVVCNEYVDSVYEKMESMRQELMEMNSQSSDSAEEAIEKAKEERVRQRIALDFDELHEDAQIHSAFGQPITEFDDEDGIFDS